jgi:hypothetical protein
MFVPSLEKATAVTSCTCPSSGEHHLNLIATPAATPSYAATYATSTRAPRLAAGLAPIPQLVCGGMSKGMVE